MIYACPKCDHRRYDPYPKNKGVPICQGVCFVVAMNNLPRMDIVEEEQASRDLSERPDPRPAKKRGGRPKGSKNKKKPAKAIKRVKPAAQVVRRAGVRKA